MRSKMKKKHLFFITAIISLFCLSLYLFPNSSLARMMPGAIIYSGTGDQAPVQFSHAIHLNYGTACNDCHSKVFKKKIGAAQQKMTMKSMQAGKFCGSCHDGEYAFSVSTETDCDKCHIK